MNDDRKFVIQRTPTGLLDLLGMQSTGDTPRTLSASVQAVLSVDQLFTIDRLQRGLGVTGTINAIGFWSAGLGPPPGEQWLVYSLQASSGAFAAATGMRYLLALLRQGLAANSQYLEGQQVVSNPNTIGSGIVFEQPLILRPGDVLGLQLTEITGLPATVVFVAAFYVAVKI